MHQCPCFRRLPPNKDTSGAKAHTEKESLIAALKRCAAQKLNLQQLLTSPDFVIPSKARDLLLAGKEQIPRFARDDNSLKGDSRSTAPSQSRRRLDPPMALALRP